MGCATSSLAYTRPQLEAEMLQAIRSGALPAVQRRTEREWFVQGAPSAPMFSPLLPRGVKDGDAFFERLITVELFQMAVSTVNDGVIESMVGMPRVFSMSSIPERFARMCEGAQAGCATATEALRARSIGVVVSFRRGGLNQLGQGQGITRVTADSELVFTFSNEAQPHDVRFEFDVFISHHMAPVPTQAAITISESLLGQHVFLDVEEQGLNIATLQHKVRNSKALAVVLSEHVWERPWCCVEVYTAIKAGIPVVPVLIVGEAYDFAKVAQHLKFLDTALGDDAVKGLREDGFDVVDMAYVLSTVVPSLIAIEFKPTAAKDLRAAQLKIIASTLKNATPQPTHVAKEDWLVARAG